MGIPCWRRNLTYVATCFRCKEAEVVAEYHGESCKSLYDRAKSHMEKLRSWDPSNFMLRHNHPENDPLCSDYLWQPTGFYQRPIQREIAEAIKIKEALAKETGPLETGPLVTICLTLLDLLQTLEGWRHKGMVEGVPPPKRSVLISQLMFRVHTLT